MTTWYRLETLGRGVYAVIDVDGGWFKSNIGLVDMGSYTLIIDTPYNEDRANDIKKLIEKLDLPEPKLIVNTHHHGDHVWTNHLFSPALSVAHEKTAKHIFKLLKTDPEKMYKPIFPNLDFRGSRYTLPDILIYETKLGIRGDRGFVEVIHLGPGHTEGDVIVLVDWAKVMFAGDLVFNNVTPLALEGSVKEWIKTLDKLRGLTQEYEVIVPGHGPISGPKVTDEVKEYLELVLKETKKLVDRGLKDPLDISLNIKLGKYMSWKAPERLVLNVKRALMDLEGAPPGKEIENIVELAKKMFEYSRRL